MMASPRPYPPLPDLTLHTAQYDKSCRSEDFNTNIPIDRFMTTTEICALSQNTVTRKRRNKKTQSEETNKTSQTESHACDNNGFFMLPVPHLHHPTDRQNVTSRACLIKHLPPAIHTPQKKTPAKTSVPFRKPLQAKRRKQPRSRALTPERATATPPQRASPDLTTAI